VVVRPHHGLAQSTSIGERWLLFNPGTLTRVGGLAFGCARTIVCVQGAAGKMNTYPQPFAIRVASLDEGSVRVKVCGELDLSTSPALDEALRREIDAGHKVILDLSEIAFIDSSGLNTLITALRACDSNGGALSVSPTLPAQVRRVLEITGLAAVLPMASE
jgi:anti-anti-sigma factor